MFLPTTKEELKKFGWDKLDIILITGDTYIDSPFIGVAIIGKLLISKGFRVGVIAQPDINSDKDITRLSEPGLFWGVTAGSLDSIVANYTALLKPRREDDLTPGGKNTKRPDRATIVYTNLIKKYFKNTTPIVLGGLEASLRRIPHYDFLEDKIRRSILFDAKADFLVYGMGEKATVEIAEKLKKLKSEGVDLKKDKEKIKSVIKTIKGICYILNEKTDGFYELPDFEQVKNDKLKFIDMFNKFYELNLNTQKGFFQKQDNRFLVQNPAQDDLTREELDSIYELDYERDAHPFYKQFGKIKAVDTIRFSVTSHRGCFGECNFCAITVHQGKNVISRSENSILKELELLTKLPDFKGYILDIGGPTANMYGMGCKNSLNCSKRCIFPKICNNLNFSHYTLLQLLKKAREIKGIKKIFIGSGVRYDIVLMDKKYGLNYLNELSNYHISGQLKIAPEHTEDKILNLMGKTENKFLLEFIEKFNKLNKDKKQFLTYYFIVAHPGCSLKDTLLMKNFIEKNFKITPEQVQIFTPTPSTYSTLMYYTEMNPFTKEKIFVEKNLKNKLKQKNLITQKDKNKSENRNSDFQEKNKKYI
jgi:uncharacterized radical SAM protein YgiQ